ncbi:RcnB family protein [Rhodoferax sp. UBA5149]|uniref:RcnB family protein n=1 Tax=Rhodoferax sp. UBA5149 TaxID=1947379 RepID=UPI0025D2E105|nr:RcnB family protein [Rhodoferax sp. UBA5149]
MNSKAIVSTLIAMSLSIGGVAFAQRDESAPMGQQNRRGNEARQQHRPQNQGRAYNNERRDERGAGPNQQFHRGDRLPPEYRNRSYVVDDWRGHHLSAPPRGYHWVQTGGDYVLVAIATGIIMQLLLNN